MQLLHDSKICFRFKISIDTMHDSTNVIITRVLLYASTREHAGTHYERGTSLADTAGLAIAELLRHYSMRAFVIENGLDDAGEKKASGSIEENMSAPVPATGEALVRVLRAGVCNTDLELLEGYMGFTGIVGHEFVGIVEKIAGSPAGSEGGESGQHSHLVGKRVVGEINLACTRCHVCEAGGDRARNHCPERTVLGILGKHGTYAEFLTLPCRNLYVVPDSVSDAAAVFAEPLAAACRIVEQGLAPTDAKAAVLGDGKLGLLIAEVLARRGAPSAAAISASTICGGGGGVGETESVTRGASVGGTGTTTLIGRHREKMEMCCAGVIDAGVNVGGECKEHFPAPALIRVDACDQPAITSLTGAFDVVVDATGSPQGLASASELCRPLGTVVLKSTCAAGAGFNAAPVVINEQRVIGSRCGPFDAALRLLASPGGIDVERYISGVFPLEEAGAALDAARKKGALKVQIICSPAARY